MKNNDYVSYDVAVILKQKGFNEYCSEEYHVGDVENIHSIGEEYYNRSYVLDRNKDMKENRIAAPCLYDVQKWLREKHQIAVCPNPYSFHWDYTIFDLSEVESDDVHKILGSRVCWESYEEALNEGIKESLNLL